MVRKKSNVDLLAHIDEELSRLWRLGRNTVVGWRPVAKGIEVLVVPHYLLSDLLSNYEDLLFDNPQMRAGTLRAVSDICEVEPYTIAFPSSAAGAKPAKRALAELLRRYSITKLEGRAVILFDIVRFSRYTPLEQVTAINSLAYSVNIGCRRAAEYGLKVEPTYTTTGDGFYVWNQVEGRKGNLALFSLMMLILVDNAIARRKAMSKVVPPLRTCFHCGTCYEFFQAVGERPGNNSYVVGDATISLARMSSGAVPGQILIGNFLGGASDGNSDERYTTLEFMQDAEESLHAFQGVSLGGEMVSSIKCYLTGPRTQGGGFEVSRYIVSDKHGSHHEVFNAKVNVHQRRGGTVYLGRREEDLEDFGGVPKGVEQPAIIPPVPPASTKESILVVEDEPDLLETAVAILRDEGYVVFEAGNASEAEHAMESHDQIDLLFSDVIIPGGVEGTALASYARARFPWIRILYTSGYSEVALSLELEHERDIEFIAKPYRMEELAEKVRQVLDGAEGAGPKT